MKLLRERLAEKDRTNRGAGAAGRPPEKTGEAAQSGVSRAALRRLAEIAADDPQLRRKATRILLSEIFADQFGPQIAGSNAFGAVFEKVEDVWLNDPELLDLTQTLAARAREQFKA